jgi:hypothetical protein
VSLSPATSRGDSGIPETLLDAKGDIIAASAADVAARLAVGADATVLVADSGEALGVKWATGAAPASLTWIAVTGGIGFANSWADWGAPFGPVKYGRDANFVYFRGVGRPGTASAVIFTLPVGYRPSFDMFIVGQGGLISGEAYCQILTTGALNLPVASDAFIGDGLRFPLGT